MKTNLLLIAFMLITFTSAVKAQTVVFGDDFESYATTTSVATLGYLMWECGATVKADIVAQSGLNYASMAGTAGKSNYMRKRFEVTAAHNYTFSVYTLSPAGITHKIGCKSQTGTLVNVISPTNLNNNTWTQQSISFTAVNTENVEFFIYIYGPNTVHSDDWKVIDNSVTTGIENTNNSSVQILKTAENELSIKGCEVNSCKLYNVSGKLIQTATRNQVILNNALKGVFVAQITDKSGAVYHSKIVL